MNTDELIERLAASAAPVRQDTLPGAATVAMAVGGAATLLMFASVFDLRPDLGRALAQPVIAAKTLLPLALGVLVLPLALTAARPAAPRWRAARLVWAVPAVAALLFLWALALPPDVGRQMAFTGKSLSTCLPAVVGLSLPMTAALIVALRNWASVRPAATGALAGLVGGGFAAAVYSLYCTEDTPLFYAVWYSLGILISGAIGAAAGARALRW